MHLPLPAPVTMADFPFTDRGIVTLSAEVASGVERSG